MRIFLLILSFIFLVSGFISGNIYSQYFAKKNNNSFICEINYEFINDSVGCLPPQVIGKQLYTEAISKLNAYISNSKKNGEITQASIYFRDLLAGPTFGLHEKDNFAPASLLKVPLLVSYLSAADEDTSILDRKIQYVGTPEVLEQSSSISSKLKEGNSYLIRDLLAKMVQDSDNLSYLLLFKSLDQISLRSNTFGQTLIELGLVNPRTPTEDTLTVKSYASLFRQLYNASYLSPRMSEFALNLLSNSSFDKGIEAGLPRGVKVAHKFGERSGFESNETQLHDCGIIYYPDNPYLLCIMTKGNSIEKQEKFIAEVSKKMFDEVSSRRLKN